jgi:hypothetical protein
MRPALSSSTWISDGEVVAFRQADLVSFESWSSASDVCGPSSSSTSGIAGSRCFHCQSLESVSVLQDMGTKGGMTGSWFSFFRCRISVFKRLEAREVSQLELVPVVVNGHMGHSDPWQYQPSDFEIIQVWALDLPLSSTASQLPPEVYDHITTMKRIPPEIHLHILEFALSDRSIYGRKFIPVWPHFALVCRCWRARVQFVAFRNTNIAWLQRNPKETQLFKHGLAELCFSSYLASLYSPYTHKLGDCIRSLVVHLVPPAQMISLLKQLPVLQSLTFLIELSQDWETLDKELETTAPRLKFLTVTGLHVFQSTDPKHQEKRDTTLFMPRLIARFPSVTCLSLEVNSAPSAPTSRWPAPPTKLVAFRSLGSFRLLTNGLISHFALSASTSTLRVLKLWYLKWQDASLIVEKHGATLECLSLHSSPKWPRNLTIAWADLIPRFVGLQHLSLACMLVPTADMLSSIPKQNLRHFEFALFPSHLGLVHGITEFLDECPSLVWVTYHSRDRIPELENFSPKRTIMFVWRKWGCVHKEPYPDYVSAALNSSIYLA